MDSEAEVSLLDQKFCRREEKDRGKKEKQKRQGEVAGGGTLDKETQGTQAPCQFLRELEQNSISSIRLLLGKEEASGPLHLPGRPGGRLPELGISEPTPEGRT